MPVRLALPYNSVRGEENLNFKQLAWNSPNGRRLANHTTRCRKFTLYGKSRPQRRV